MEVRDFNLRESTWSTDHGAHTAIRRLVFTVELALAETKDADDQNEQKYTDDQAWHWLATNSDDHHVGTCCLQPSGEISHLAVLKEYRHKGIGVALIEQATNKAQYLGYNAVYFKLFDANALYFKQFVKILGFKPEQTHANRDSHKITIITKHLSPLMTTNQRKFLTALVPDTSLQAFDVAEGDWHQHNKLILSLRRQVFQLGKEYSETDDLDTHFLAQSPDAQLIGVLQLSADGILKNMVVDSHFRRIGVGKALIEAAVSKAKRAGILIIKIPTNQLVKMEYSSYFEHVGFVLNEADSRIQKTIEASDPHRQRLVQGLSQAQGNTPDSTYQLGVTKDFLVLQKLEEFEKLVGQMCAQAKQSLQILSPYLDHKIFDNQAMQDICSRLARRNKYTSIEILLYDPHRVIKNGHKLVELSKKLSSSIHIKIVHPELRQSNHEYVLVDGCAYTYRQDIEIYEGYGNFNDVTECNRLKRQFKSAWESALEDPNLRRIKL